MQARGVPDEIDIVIVVINGTGFCYLGGPATIIDWGFWSVPAGAVFDFRIISKDGKFIVGASNIVDNPIPTYKDTGILVNRNTATIYNAAPDGTYRGTACVLRGV